MTDENRLIAGRYRLERRIGSGAMGVVWQARDERLHRIVAVKQLLLQPGLEPAEAEEARQRAMREGRIAARLHHPNAVSVFDVAEEDGQPWLVMEYLPSHSLASVVEERGPLSPWEAARVGNQVATALAAAHDAGIVHRDVKPGNILLGDNGTVKITDFGISRAAGDVTVTKTGMLAGTPAYLAPEVAKGREPEAPSDVFSLGATLYATVEGEPPFGLHENSLALLHSVAAGQIRPPQRSGALTDVLMRLLHADPAQRPTMPQAAEALAAVAAGRSVSLPTTPLGGGPLGGGEPLVETTTRIPPVQAPVLQGTAMQALMTRPRPGTTVQLVHWPSNGPYPPSPSAPAASGPVLYPDGDTSTPRSGGKTPALALAIGALVVVAIVVSGVFIVTGMQRTATEGQPAVGGSAGSSRQNTNGSVTASGRPSASSTSPTSSTGVSSSTSSSVKPVDSKAPGSGSSAPSGQSPGAGGPHPSPNPSGPSDVEVFEQTVRNHIATVNRMDWPGAFRMLGAALRNACNNDPEVYHNSAWNGVTAVALTQALSVSEPDKMVVAHVQVTLTQGGTKDEEFDFFYDPSIGMSTISGMSGPH
ncbi:MAG: serine/threonine protein kinase [Kutzneria sp.]|nr:serine/threonine protein kinase [Kutzneria sp.]